MSNRATMRTEKKSRRRKGIGVLPTNSLAKLVIGCCLTIRLSGRLKTRPARRERKIAQRARGAFTTTRHGPLQPKVRRLLTRNRLYHVEILIEQEYRECPRRLYCWGIPGTNIPPVSDIDFPAVARALRNEAAWWVRGAGFRDKRSHGRNGLLLRSRDCISYPER